MKRKQTIYISPRVRVVEIKVQSMLCGSRQTFSLQDDGQFTSGDDDDPWAN